MFVVVVRGGTVQEVYDAPPRGEESKRDEVWLVDWDDIQSGDHARSVTPVVCDVLPEEIAQQLTGGADES